MHTALRSWVSTLFFCYTRYHINFIICLMCDMHSFSGAAEAAYHRPCARDRSRVLLKWRGDHTKQHEHQFHHLRHHDEVVQCTDPPTAGSLLSEVIINEQ